MRLFVQCRSCGQEINIYYIASTRDELPYNIDVSCPNISCRYEETYSRYEVQAAEGVNPVAGGAVIGGLLGGLIGGPLGLIIGGTLGAGAGKNAQQQEEERIQRFNDS